MLPVNPVPVLQIPTGIGTLLGGLAVGAFIALVIGFLLHRRDDTAPAIEVPRDAGTPVDGEKPTRISA